MKTIASLLVLAVLIALFVAYPIMLLWNSCLVPAVTVVNEIGYWQALGIYVLCNALFKVKLEKS